jgi:hypothetical protein
MTNVIRWVVVAVLVGHGLIHLLGAAKGLGWAEVSRLEGPIGPGLGAVWLLAAVLVLVSAGFMAAGTPTWWWAVALGGAAVSQVAISTSWNDAKAGTAVNVVLVLAAAYAFVSVGPASLQAQWREQASQALTASDRRPALVTEMDLADLPVPIAAYVRRSGAVGQPRVTSFAASFHGRIRSGPSEPWMTFTGRQVNTYGSRPQRVFILDATRSGLPVTVLHQFADARATMRAKVLSLVPVVDAAGPEMDQGETVTVFNDLVVFAPGAIVDAPIRWTAMDATHVRGVFTNGDLSVSAVLTFDTDHRLVDFTSLDRLRASSDGKSFTALSWSTPLSGHRDFGGHLLPRLGEARWDAPLPEGSFTYVELDLDDIAYNVRDLGCFSAGGMAVTHRPQGQLPAPAAP